MNETIYIKIDVEDSNWLKSLDVLSLFPEHYSPVLMDTSEREIVDVAFSGGKGRFIFHDHEVECCFEYYDDDEDYDNEWDEFKDYSDNVGRELANYVAEEISSCTGLAVNCV
ncbi:TPA: hypothetical protein ACGVBV_004287 [Vibrio vulnificus]